MFFVPAALALVCALVGFSFGEVTSGLLFAGVAVGCSGVGCALFIPFKDCEDLTIHGSFATAAAAWLLFSLCAAIPFLVWNWTGEAPGEFDRWDNCVFEGTSAATSAGLTIIEDTAALPHAFQLWRSLCQWIGGLGVVVLVLTMFDIDGEGTLLRGVRRHKRINNDVSSTISVVWKVHGTITAAFILLFGLFGMPWWEAINHGLSAISTGGFTMNGSGIGAYSRTLQVLVMLAMIAGAISYFSHYTAIFKRQPKAWFASPAHWAFYTTLLVGAGAILVLADGTPLFELGFLWVSALTTCGFSLSDPGEVAGSIQLALVGAMTVGGMAGSTAGGVKFSRIIALGRHLFGVIGTFLARGDAAKMEKLEEAMQSDLDLDFETRMAFAISGLWIVATWIGVFALMFVYKDWGGAPIKCLFEAMSALGCVGLSAGVTSADLDTMPKLVLCTLMWAGRIEILPVVMLIALCFPRGTRSGGDA